MLKKINNFKVKTVNIPEPEIKKIGGSALFPLLYPNILIVSKKKTGKTTIISNIVSKCTNKKTSVWIFCPSVKKDDTYREITKSLEARKINYNCFYDVEDSEEGPVLNELIEALRRDEDDDDEQIKLKKLAVVEHEPKLYFGGESDKARVKREMKKIENEEERAKKAEAKSKKKVYPTHLFIFDDLSVALRNKAISKLLKTNRHLRALVVLSAHTITDLKPDARKQIDVCLVSSSLNVEKLEDLYKDLNVSIPFEDFLVIYNTATSQSKFDYLYIDTRSDSFRKNFSHSVELENKTEEE